MRQRDWSPGQIAAFGLCLAFLVWANLKTPFWADDYCRMIDASLINAVLRSSNEYLNWSGRFFANAITYVVMGTGRQWSVVWFDILNALIFVGLISIVLRLAGHASGHNSNRRPNFPVSFTDTIFVGLLLWWVPRTIGEVALWKTGSIGYLWPTTGELLIMERVLSGKPLRLWLVPFAFIIATFLEPLSVLVSATLAMLAARRRGQGSLTRTKSIAVACAHAAGTVFLLAAPGNFARSYALPPSPPLDRLAGVTAATGSLFDGYTIAVVIVVALPFVIREQRLRTWIAPCSHAARRPADIVPLHRHNVPYRAGNGWIFLILALAYMTLLLGVPRPALAARATFPASVFLSCYAACMFQLRPLSPLLNQLMLYTVTLLAVLQCAIVGPDLARLARIDRRWTETLKPLVGSGADVTVPLVRFGGKTLRVHKYFFFAGITPDPAYFINVCYARAMGLRTITGR